VKVGSASKYEATEVERHASSIFNRATTGGMMSAQPAIVKTEVPQSQFMQQQVS